MKLLLTPAALLLASTALAQAPADPVTSSATRIYNRTSKNILAAAQAMPADKYSYSPTPTQWTFGKVISHIAASNGTICGLISGNAAPATVKVDATAPKDALVAGLQASLDFCSAALANLHDAQLGDEITTPRGAKAPRAAMLIELTADLPDHYSQLAMYMRLNNLLPPSAAPKK
ncbi:MAG: DinB family protein [Acidobacteriota bacterium]